jgi:uncharacterized protein (UPF0332 family)
VSQDELDLVRKARDSVRAAKLMLSDGLNGFAASRAYYAMFYVAQAFLERDGLTFSSHSAVIAGSGKQLARAGQVPAKFHRYLIDAERSRLRGDYDSKDTVEPDVAAEHIAHAEEFIEAAERLLGPPTEDEPIGMQ